MAQRIVFSCLLLAAGCGQEIVPSLGLGRPDAIAQAHADVERLAVQIKEEKEALAEDSSRFRRADGEEKERLGVVVAGEQERIKHMEERQRSTEVRIRELEAERRTRDHQTQ